MTARALDWKELARLRVVEIGVALALTFVIVRIVMPRSDGAEVLAREAAVLETLREVHAAQSAGHAAESTMRWLPQLVADAARGSRLAALAPVGDDGVDLFLADGYYVALYVADPGRPDDRAWTSSQASAEAGAHGYGVFAWPETYGRGTQWAFFVDHRGKLLGSWNHAGLLDGKQEPFPPTAHPLRDYLAAKQDGEDAEWLLFTDVGEIVLRPVSAVPADG